MTAGLLLAMRGGGMVGWTGVWVLLLAVLVFFAVRSLKTVRGDMGRPTGRSTEERIETLKDRYVDGELTTAEYEKRLEHLYEDRDNSDRHKA